MDRTSERYPTQKMGGGDDARFASVFFFGGGGAYFLEREDFLGLSEIDLLHERAYFFLDSCVKFLKGGTCSFRIYIYIHLFLQAHMCIYLSVLIYTYTIALYEFQPAQKTIKLVFWSSQFLRRKTNSNSAPKDESSTTAATGTFQISTSTSI